MSKGVTAMMLVVGVLLSVTVLAALGFYAGIGMQYPENANQQVQDAAEDFTGQEATDRSGGSAQQDFTTSAADTLSAGWEIISNTSGVLQLLVMFPKVLADAIQSFIRIAFGLMFLFFIRGLVL
jgi:hypothetical protein